MQARAMCYRCHKVEALCVCARIAPVKCTTPVFVVQHPREARHPIGSLRFARLGLQDCQVHVAEAAGDGRVRTAAAIPEGAALLFPGPEARPIDELEGAQRPRALVALDGTWSTVKALLKGDPRLAKLPRVRLPNAHPQRYRIRREPRDECMSTLEAIATALAYLEPERKAELAALMQAFDTMIDQQIELAGSLHKARVRHPRRGRPQRKVPNVVSVAAKRVVLVLVESTQINRMHQPGTRARRQLVRLSALRVASGAYFDALAQVPGFASKAKQIEYMQIEPKMLAGALDAPRLQRAWADFLEPEDHLVAWNQVDLDLSALLLPSQGSTTSSVLKGAYAQTRGRRAGAIEDACERESLPLGGAFLPGRAGQRLEGLRQVLVLLQGLHAPEGHSSGSGEDTLGQPAPT